MFEAGFNARWHARCQGDAVLASRGRAAQATILIEAEAPLARIILGDGTASIDAPGPADITLKAPRAVWEKYLAPTPPRHHHNLFAMLRRVPEFSVAGDDTLFIQHAPQIRRVLDVARWLVRGGTGATPVSLRPAAPAFTTPAGIRGRYVPVTACGTDYTIHAQEHGSGRDMLCLHTAGSDGRQFHRLMADPRLAGWRMVAPDLPWHGKSPGPAGAIPGSWTLNTELYCQLIMGFCAAYGLRRPVFLGASMSGEIGLEMALRHPDQFTAIIACEATDHIAGRRTPWADHPRINQANFVPEWVEGLMAPQSPAECADDIWWQYSQGGAATFAGDINFYSGEWDARDRVHQIDTTRCPLHMLTGEYDYSCTMEASAATAAKIPGARFQPMPGMGHFPFAENPALFAQYLLPILAGV